MALAMLNTGRLAQWCMTLALAAVALGGTPIVTGTDPHALWSLARETASPAMDVLVLAADVWL